MDHLPNPAITTNQSTLPQDWNIFPQPGSILRSYLTRRVSEAQEEDKVVCPTLRLLLTSNLNLQNNESESNQFRFGIPPEMPKDQGNIMFNPRGVAVPVKKRKIFDASIPFRNSLGAPKTVTTFAPKSVQEAVVSTTNGEEVHSYSRIYYPSGHVSRLEMAGTSSQCSQCYRCSICERAKVEAMEEHYKLMMAKSPMDDSNYFQSRFPSYPATGVTQPKEKPDEILLKIEEDKPEFNYDIHQLDSLAVSQNLWMIKYLARQQEHANETCVKVRYEVRRSDPMDNGVRNGRVFAKIVYPPEMKIEEKRSKRPKRSHGSPRTKASTTGQNGPRNEKAQATQHQIPKPEELPKENLAKTYVCELCLRVEDSLYDIQKHRYSHLGFPVIFWEFSNLSSNRYFFEAVPLFPNLPNFQG